MIILWMLGLLLPILYFMQTDNLIAFFLFLVVYLRFYADYHVAEE